METIKDILILLTSPLTLFIILVTDIAKDAINKHYFHYEERK